VEQVDPSSGLGCYYNATSGVTSWERPTEEEEEIFTSENLNGVEEGPTRDNNDDDLNDDEEEKEENDETTDDLPDGWTEAKDPTNGQIYYYNSTSGVTSWERPANVEETRNSSDSSLGDKNEEESVNDNDDDDDDDDDHDDNEEKEEDVDEVPDELPDGWVESEDPISGQTYYYHNESGETRWERPTAEETEIDLAMDEDANKKRTDEVVDGSDSGDNGDSVENILDDAIGGVLPDGWVEGKDPSTGQTFYYHSESEETSWERPTMKGVEVELPDVLDDDTPQALIDDSELVVDNEYENERNAFEETPVEGKINETNIPVLSLADGWEEVDDSSTGETYFYHSESGETRWERPMKDEMEKELTLKSVEMDDTNEMDVIDENEIVNEDQDIFEPLPEWWVENEDETSGKIYYFNSLTGEVNWDRPKAEIPLDETEKAGLECEGDSEIVEEEEEVEYSETGTPPLPDNWIESTDPTTGEIYYYNIESEETSWERPVSFKVPVEDEDLPIEPNIEYEQRTSAEVEELTGDDNDCDCEPSETEDLDEWEEVDDPSGEKSYFFNRTTGETSWDRPTRMVSKTTTIVPPESSDEKDNQIRDDNDKDSDDLLEGWVEVVDPSSGDSYWFNSETQETTWEKPSKPVDNNDVGTFQDESMDVDGKEDMVNETSNVDQDRNIRDDWVDVQDPQPEEKMNEQETLIPTLPEGWVESTDPSTGQVFYWNEITDETSWERPKEDPPTTDTISIVAPAGTFNDKVDESIVTRLILEIENERRKFGVIGPFTAGDSTVIEYINNKGKSDDILWQLISIAAKSNGKLRSEYGVDDKLGPEAAIVKLLLGESINERPATPRRKKKRSDIIVEEKNEAEMKGRDLIVRVEDHLIHGEREDAINDAMAGGDFATALLVASMCGPEAYKSVAQKFATHRFRTDSPMYTTTSLFSGKVDAPSFWGEKPDELVENWKDNLAAILNNRTLGWDKVVLSLGDKLKEIGRIEEAHFCYMVCGHPIKSPTETETRLALLGCDHSDARNLALLTNESLNAFERTEAYEWAKRQANPAACFGPFQPFKLVYAMLLADAGKITEAQQFVKSIRLPADIAKLSDFPDINKVSVSQMFDESEAFKLACNEIKHRLQSQDSPQIQYAELLENGNSLDIDTTRIQRVAENRNGNMSRRQKGITNAVSGPPSDLNDSRSILQRGGMEQHVVPMSNNDAALDSTFMTAKSNLMDISGYTLEGTGENVHSSNKGQTNRTSLVNKKVRNVTTTGKGSCPKPVDLNPVPIGEGANKFLRTTGSTTKQQSIAKDTTTNIPPPQSGTEPPNSKKSEEHEQQISSTMNPVVVSTPKAQERPKPAPVTAPPVMTGRKAEKPMTPGPASGSKTPKAPNSGLFRGMKSYLVKRFNPDAKYCELPDNEEKPYYDNDSKRWIFPGDDPTEVAKPLAPPPTIGKMPTEEVKSTETEDDGIKDPFAAMMAAPVNRTLSAKRRPGGIGGGRFPPGMMGGAGAGPPSMSSPPGMMGGGGGPSGMSSPPGMIGAGSPPGMMMPAQFSVFAPKPAAAAAVAVAKEDPPNTTETTK